MVQTQVCYIYMILHTHIYIYTQGDRTCNIRTCITYHVRYLYIYIYVCVRVRVNGFVYILDMYSYIYAPMICSAPIYAPGSNIFSLSFVGQTSEAQAG